MVPTNDINYLKNTIRLHPITCPYLFIGCEQSLTKSPIVQTILREVQELEKMKIQYVNGGHDVHMLNPQLVAPVITQFLLQSEAKL